MPGENELDAPLAKIKRKSLRESRKPAIRLQVFAIWAFVAVLYGITRSETAWRLFEISSRASLAFFLWLFVQGPYLLYTRQSLPSRADYRIFSGQLEPELPAYRVKDLASLGFKLAGQLVQEPGKRNVAVRLGLFIHPENKDSAHLCHVVGGLRTIPMLVFKSRFDDGFAFETSDSHMAYIFQPDPNCPTFRFPAVRSTLDLYRLHRKIKEKLADAHHPKLGDERAELEAFIARAEVVRERFAQSGDYRLAPSGDHYVYTLRGAIRHAWLAAWPIKFLRSTRVQGQGMKMAEELGLLIHPKFGRLQESVPRRGETTDRRGL